MKKKANSPGLSQRVRTLEVSPTVAMSIKPSARANGFWKRTPSGMNTRLYVHIASSR